MADNLVSILEAIDSLLATEIATGGDLEDARSYSVKYQTTESPPGYGYLCPSIMVDPLPVTPKAISIPPIMTLKEQPIRFRVLIENNGDTTDKTAAELLDLVETLFYQRTFDLAEWVETVSKEYSSPTEEPFAPPVYGAATLVINYKHVDVRAIPSY